MKQDEREKRREEYNKNITHEHEVVLRELENIVESLWKGEKLISYYTEHGIAHSYRIIENINRIIEGKEAESNLKENDYFILYASAFIHDIGMQCDLGKHLDVYNSLKKRGVTTVVFDKKAAEYTEEQQNELRRIHNEVSIEWISLAFKNELSDTNFNKMLVEVMKKIKKIGQGLVEDIMDICVYHTKRDIEKISNEMSSSTINNKKLLANIFRLADELDFDSDRVHDYDGFKSFNNKEFSEFIYWYHSKVEIDFDENKNIIVNQFIAEEDEEIFSNKLMKDLIDKNKNIIDFLNNNRIRININIKKHSLGLYESIPEEYKKYFDQEDITENQNILVKEDIKNKNIIKKFFKDPEVFFMKPYAETELLFEKKLTIKYQYWKCGDDFNPNYFLVFFPSTKSTRKAINDYIKTSKEKDIPLPKKLIILKEENIASFVQKPLENEKIHINFLLYSDYLWSSSVPKKFKDYKHNTKQIPKYFQDQDIDILNTNKVASSENTIWDYIDEESISPIFIILAQAGVGKSTLINKILRGINNNFRGPNPKKHLGPIQSIFIPSGPLIEKYLRRQRENYPKIESVWDLYNAYMYSHEDKKDLYLDQNVFEAAIFSGTVVIMIDGLDEIITFFGSKFNTERFITSAKELNNQLARCKIIITSREYYWKNNSLLEDNELLINRLYGFNKVLLDKYLRERYENEPNKIRLVKNYLERIDFHREEEGDIVKPYLVDLFCEIADSKKMKEDSNIDGISEYPNNGEIIDRAIYYILNREVLNQLRYKLDIERLIDIYINLAIHFGSYFDEKDLSTAIAFATDKSSISKEDKKVIIDAMKFSPLISTIAAENCYSIKYKFLKNYFIVLYILRLFSAKKEYDKDTFDRRIIGSISAFDKEDNESFNNVVKYFRIKQNKDIFLKNAKKIIALLINKYKEERSGNVKELIEHAISAILYLAINITNKSSSKDKKMELIKMLYGAEDEIKYLFIFGDFFPLDFSNTIICDSKLDAYNNLLDSTFSNSKFERSKIINFQKTIDANKLKKFHDNAMIYDSIEHSDVLSIRDPKYKKNKLRQDFRLFLEKNFFMKDKPFILKNSETDKFTNSCIKLLNEKGFLEENIKTNSKEYILIKKYNKQIGRFIDHNDLGSKNLEVVFNDLFQEI